MYYPPTGLSFFVPNYSIFVKSKKLVFNMLPTCTLCNGESSLFHTYQKREYYRCKSCQSVFVGPNYFPNPEDEKERYLTHNNDVYDPGYRKFAKPITDVVLNDFTGEHCGLDFGAGTGPVICKVLGEKGYNIEPYDPFFCNNIELLERQYDYIVCCEVIEHFFKPQKEFAQLRSMLKPNGKLICMTDFYSDDIDFSKWYYKNDPTHVFFYHKHALSHIEKAFGFSKCFVNNRLVWFGV